VAFDPDPRARKILGRNLELNSIDNVVVENLCVSDHVGNAQLRTLRLGDSASSLVRYESSMGATEIPVQTTTLDDYCTKNNIVPDGIKIDVEGAEGMVFDGMNKILGHSPWIVLEFHPGFMTKEQKQETWSKVTARAKKVTYLGGDASDYSEGRDIPSEQGFLCPNGSRFQVLLNY
jgi:FkbM family methyltransferase